MNRAKQLETVSTQVQPSRSDGNRGGGRPRGSKNRVTKHSLAIAAGICNKAGNEWPLEFMLRTMNDTRKSDEVRGYFAVQAAPYCHQKQISMDLRATGDIAVTVQGHKMSLSDMQQAFRQLRDASPEVLEQQLKMIEASVSNAVDDVIEGECTEVDE